MKILRSFIVLPAISFLVSTYVYAQSCPTSYTDPDSSETYRIYPLEQKQATKSQLEHQLLYFKDMVSSPLPEGSGLMVNDEDVPFVGCDHKIDMEQKNFGLCANFSPHTVNERIKILYDIYSCHKNAGWPSATDSNAAPPKQFKDSQKPKMISRNEISRNLADVEATGQDLVNKKVKLLQAVPENCLSIKTVDGMETIVNSCSYKIMWGLCATSVEGGYERFLCNKQPSGISPTGINYMTSSLEVEANSENTTGIRVASGKTYFLMGCKLPNLPVIYAVNFNGNRFYSGCYPAGSK